ncbi:MAG: nucleotidyl transferase AbiEii/AbiGii toxin family protein [Desulfatitalea sp.]|nr:nucleotidyl transferase AbiEii/AbiGii toxin family protein [Desulfatitalea sp.]
MKSHDLTRIRQAEIAQLILLQSLFALKESREIIFQGGTAIRWFLGGLRFSEDLDFVTPLDPEAVAHLVAKMAGHARRLLIANFGEGELTVHGKGQRPTAYKAFLNFAPVASRGKIRIKLEFERLAHGVQPETVATVMQSSPAVGWFLREGGFRSAGAGVVIRVETAREILTDKLRALMERPYTKGRDFFDVWFLTRTVGTCATAANLRRKLNMYAIPFKENTRAAFYETLDTLDTVARQRLVREIQQDLIRFLDIDTLQVFEENGFDQLLSAVQETFCAVVNPAIGVKE